MYTVCTTMRKGNIVLSFHRSSILRKRSGTCLWTNSLSMLIVAICFSAIGADQHEETHVLNCVILGTSQLTACWSIHWKESSLPHSLRTTRGIFPVVQPDVTEPWKILLRCAWRKVPTTAQSRFQNITQCVHHFMDCATLNYATECREFGADIHMMDDHH